MPIVPFGLLLSALLLLNQHSRAESAPTHSDFWRVENRGGKSEVVLLTPPGVQVSKDKQGRTRFLRGASGQKLGQARFDEAGHLVAFISADGTKTLFHRDSDHGSLTAISDSRGRHSRMSQ